MTRAAMVLAGVVLLSTPAIAWSQSAPSQAPGDGGPHVQVGIGLLGSSSVGEFAEHVEGGGGVLFHLGVGPRDSVLTVGGEISIEWYGEESREVPFSTTIPDVTVTVNTDNKLVLAHARARLQRRRGRWRPYADGLFGLSRIFTTTSIPDIRSGPGDATSALSYTNLSDVGPSYGGGAGVMVGFGSPPSRATLDIAVRYLAGPPASYLTEGAIRRENGEVFLDVSRSRTDIVAVYLGVAWDSP